ncbi:hypothetical protein [Streptomyces sp. NPDC048641]|uniref:hypothetical protein n=1 Tax=Streptomyces sp. NPDC048641 TaxID=3154825 RepID=UPI00342AD40E
MREQQWVAVRTDELGALAGAGRLDRTVASQAGDEATRELLDDRDDYRVGAIDGWLARAFADQSGHYVDPGARAALLAALARTGAPVDGGARVVAAGSAWRGGRHERPRRLARQRGRGEGRHGVSAADEGAERPHFTTTVEGGAEEARALARFGTAL